MASFLVGAITGGLGETVPALAPIAETLSDMISRMAEVFTMSVGLAAFCDLTRSRSRRAYPRPKGLHE